MKAPLGRSFHSVLGELAVEMKKFSEMDHRKTNLLKENTENSNEVEDMEEHHVC